MTSKYQPCAAYAAIDKCFAWGQEGKWEHIDLEPVAYNALRGMLHDARCFVFDFAESDAGGEKQTSPIVQFTSDCVTAGLFQPPFDVTVLQWPDSGSWRYAAAMIVTLMRGGQPTKWGRQLPSALGRLGTNVAHQGCLAVAYGFGVCPLAFTDCPVPDEMRDIAILQDQNAIISWPSGQSIGSDKPCPDHLLGLNFLRSSVLDPAQMRADSAVTIRNLFYYMGILGSRGPVSRTVSPDPKVAQRREREGRSPWVSYSVISLPSNASGGGERSSDGRLRSSPRQHWRRGHIRTLPTGKLTVVSPCLVGASELGQVIASYHVGKEAADVEVAA